MDSVFARRHSLSVPTWAKPSTMRRPEAAAGSRGAGGDLAGGERLVRHQGGPQDHLLRDALLVVEDVHGVDHRLLAAGRAGEGGGEDAPLAPSRCRRGDRAGRRCRRTRCPCGRASARRARRRTPWRRSGRRSRRRPGASASQAVSSSSALSRSQSATIVSTIVMLGPWEIASRKPMLAVEHRRRSRTALDLHDLPAALSQELRRRTGPPACRRAGCPGR